MSLYHRPRAHAMRLLIGLLVSPAAAVFNCQPGEQGTDDPYSVGANATMCATSPSPSISMTLLNGFVNVFGNSNDDAFVCAPLDDGVITNRNMADCQATVDLINLILSSDVQYNPSVERSVPFLCPSESLQT